MASQITECITVTDNERIVLGKRLGRGGEAVVYEVEAAPQLVAKIYHENRSPPIEKLRLMINNPPNIVEEGFNQVPLAWPLDLLRDDQYNIVGYLMPKVSGGVPIYMLYSLQDRKEIVGLTWADLHRVAYNLVIILDAIHEKGYRVGDLNESNILVYPAGIVSFIDVDSFEVPQRGDGKAFRCKMGKVDYFPPELQGENAVHFPRLRQHDNFAMAVLIFQLLQEGRHPFMGLGNPTELEKRIELDMFPHKKENSLEFRQPERIQVPRWALPFEVLSIDVQELFVQAFDEGHRNPQQRPSPADWLYILDQEIQRLVVCRDNSNHLYYAEQSRYCPWCERKKLLGGVDAFPPSLHPILVDEPQYLLVKDELEDDEVVPPPPPPVKKVARFGEIKRIVASLNAYLLSAWPMFQMIMLFIALPLYLAIAPSGICWSYEILESANIGGLSLWAGGVAVFFAVLVFFLSVIGVAILAVPLLVFEVLLSTFNISPEEASLLENFLSIANDFLYHRCS